MSDYVQEMERVFSYIFVDNRLDTPSDNQVLSDIFGSREIGRNSENDQLQGKHYLQG